jgi:hypothetical protein
MWRTIFKTLRNDVYLYKTFINYSVLFQRPIPFTCKYCSSLWILLICRDYTCMYFVHNCTSCSICKCFWENKWTWISELVISKRPISFPFECHSLDKGAIRTFVRFAETSKGGAQTHNLLNDNTYHIYI